MGYLRMRQKIQARKAITPATDGYEGKPLKIGEIRINENRISKF